MPHHDEAAKLIQIHVCRLCPRLRGRRCNVIASPACQPACRSRLSFSLGDRNAQRGIRPKWRSRLAWAFAPSKANRAPLSLKLSRLQPKPRSAPSLLCLPSALGQAGAAGPGRKAGLVDAFASEAAVDCLACPEPMAPGHGQNPCTLPRRSATAATLRIA